MCPVCADRAVQQGYNDLAATDADLLPEWDFERNADIRPTEVSRNSMKGVWWRCRAGHSYRAKITGRTHEEKPCPKCEVEFRQALPQLLIMMYAAKSGVAVRTDSNKEIGMPLMAYLPELKCAVEVEADTETEKREQSVKAHICKCNRVDYRIIKRTEDVMQMAAAIKAVFAHNHIYLNADSEQDIKELRARFMSWKYK